MYSAVLLGLPARIFGTYRGAMARLRASRPRRGGAAAGGDPDAHAERRFFADDRAAIAVSFVSVASQATPVIRASNGRAFATFPAAIVAAIVNPREELLLLQSPQRGGTWQPLNGAVESEETLLDAALREVREEAGPALAVRPLGVVHASTFSYDPHVRHMISVLFLMACEGGQVQPGDDMRGSRVRWVSFPAIDCERLTLLPPLDQPWLRARTLELFRLWRDADLPLQGPLAPNA